MKLYRLLFTCLTLLSANAFSQQLNITPLQANVQQAVAKAYPASVRMWGIDTAKHQQMSAQFSGVVVSADGYILTAAHTTTPGQTFLVMFPSGKQAVALALGKIELRDDRTIPDVALMKIITPGTWPFAEMGYSSSLKENQPCISIAYPESLNQPLPSIRFGRITSVKNDRGFVQSTCIMEPGDSGGPLFDLFGRVIGLHSAINIEEFFNYEIPVDLYRKYWTALQKAQKYNDYPEVTDAVPADPQATSITSYKQLENIAGNFKADTRSTVLLSGEVKGKQEKIYGAVFAGKKGSIIVSKSSMVGNTPVVTADGKTIAATIVRRDRDNDLVVLQSPVAIKGAISITAADTMPFSHLGKFLLSPRLDTASAISVAGSLPFGLPKFLSMGFLGASVPYKAGPLMLSFVRKGSPAADAGLKEGDQVIAVNSIAMDKPENYGNELQKYWPGDTVTMQLKRGDSAYTKQIVLTDRPAIAPGNHPAEMFAGGKSVRRDGLSAVFTHDAILTPSQCGGPVFDATGHFEGINIARFSRTSTVAVPASVVLKLIAGL